MSALSLLESLKSQGVELSPHGDQLRVRCSKAPLTLDQKKLISENKLALLQHFSSSQSGTLKSPAVVGPTPGASSVYREYPGEKGEPIQFTKEEFDEVVDVFRILYEQDTKLRLSAKAA